jgi:hypothetical protein
MTVVDQRDCRAAARQLESRYRSRRTRAHDGDVEDVSQTSILWEWASKASDGLEPDPAFPPESR